VVAFIKSVFYSLVLTFAFGAFMNGLEEVLTLFVGFFMSMVVVYPFVSAKRAEKEKLKLLGR